jgi:hypothetical protein
MKCPSNSFNDNRDIRRERLMKPTNWKTDFKNSNSTKPSQFVIRIITSLSLYLDDCCLFLHPNHVREQCSSDGSNALNFSEISRLVRDFSWWIPRFIEVCCWYFSIDSVYHFLEVC